jgi:hypothetical protein
MGMDYPRRNTRFDRFGSRPIFVQEENYESKATTQVPWFSPHVSTAA